MELPELLIRTNDLSVADLIEVIRARCRNFIMAIEEPTNEEERYFTVWGDNYYTSLGLAHGIIEEMNDTLYGAREEDEEDEEPAY